MSSVAELLQWAQLALQESSDSADIDASYLICASLECSRSYLYTWPDAQISDKQEAKFRGFVARRQQGEPVAYICKERGFWNQDLTVTSDVLIPRPATEALVEVALQRAPKHCVDVLDMGTGSGAIACALASERQEWAILALDKSAKALLVAIENQQRLTLANLQLIQSDWFTAVAGQCFDVIVSNPPYIDADDEHLQKGDLRFEPQTALVAADRGLADLQHIIGLAPNFLHDGGLLALEHGYQQASDVASLLRERGFSDVQLQHDLEGQPRVSSAIWVNAII